MGADPETLNTAIQQAQSVLACRYVEAITGRLQNLRLEQSSLLKHLSMLDCYHSRRSPLAGRLLLRAKSLSASTARGGLHALGIKDLQALHVSAACEKILSTARPQHRPHHSIVFSLILPTVLPAGAPMEVTEDLLTTFNISLVVRGTVSETGADGADADAARYALPREKGVFRCAITALLLPEENLNSESPTPKLHGALT